MTTSGKTNVMPVGPGPAGTLHPSIRLPSAKTRRAHRHRSHGVPRTKHVPTPSHLTLAAVAKGIRIAHSTNEEDLGVLASNEDPMTALQALDFEEDLETWDIRPWVRPLPIQTQAAWASGLAATGDEHEHNVECTGLQQLKQQSQPLRGALCLREKNGTKRKLVDTAQPGPTPPRAPRLRPVPTPLQIIEMDPMSPNQPSVSMSWECMSLSPEPLSPFELPRGAVGYSTSPSGSESDQHLFGSRSLSSFNSAKDLL